MKNWLPILCEYLEKNVPVALAGVVAQHGSTPRGAGSALVADAHGLVTGTVGGGLSEGETLKACLHALRDGKARMLNFELDGMLAAQSDMICGGNLKVLVEPLLPGSPHKAVFLALRDALHGEGGLLLTDIADEVPRRTARIGGNRADGRRVGAPLPEGVLAALCGALPPEREAAVLSHEGRTYFVERCQPPPRMIIAGGGHISRATAQIADLAGFAVTVLDNREEFAHAGRFPWAERVRFVPRFHDCFSHDNPGPRDCVVIVTQGHVHDAAVLWQALRTEAGYIGMIGSVRKREQVYASLREQGVDAAALERVRSPVGLAIGAETPEEIAVSIVAQCIAFRRKACPPKNTPR